MGAKRDTLINSAKIFPERFGISRNVGFVKYEYKITINLPNSNSLIFLKHY